MHISNSVKFEWIVSTLEPKKTLFLQIFQQNFFQSVHLINFSISQKVSRSKKICMYIKSCMIWYHATEGLSSFLPLPLEKGLLTFCYTGQGSVLTELFAKLCMHVVWILLNTYVQSCIYLSWAWAYSTLSTLSVTSRKKPVRGLVFAFNFLVLHIWWQNFLQNYACSYGSYSKLMYQAVSIWAEHEHLVPFPLYC